MLFMITCDENTAMCSQCVLNMKNALYQSTQGVERAGPVNQLLQTSQSVGGDKALGVEPVINPPNWFLASADLDMHLAQVDILGRQKQEIHQEWEE